MDNIQNMKEIKMIVKYNTECLCHKEYDENDENIDLELEEICSYSCMQDLSKIDILYKDNCISFNLMKFNANIRFGETKHMEGLKSIELDVNTYFIKRYITCLFKDNYDDWSMPDKEIKGEIVIFSNKDGAINKFKFVDRSMLEFDLETEIVTYSSIDGKKSNQLKFDEIFNIIKFLDQYDMQLEGRE